MSPQCLEFICPTAFCLGTAITPPRNIAHILSKAVITADGQAVPVFILHIVRRAITVKVRLRVFRRTWIGIIRQNLSPALGGIPNPFAAFFLNTFIVSGFADTDIYLVTWTGKTTNDIPRTTLARICYQLAEDDII